MAVAEAAKIGLAPLEHEAAVALARAQRGWQRRGSYAPPPQPNRKRGASATVLRLPQLRPAQGGGTLGTGSLLPALWSGMGAEHGGRAGSAAASTPSNNAPGSPRNNTWFGSGNTIAGSESDGGALPRPNSFSAVAFVNQRSDRALALRQHRAAGGRGGGGGSGGGGGGGVPHQRARGRRHSAPGVNGSHKSLDGGRKAGGGKLGSGTPAGGMPGYHLPLPSPTTTSSEAHTARSDAADNGIQPGSPSQELASAGGGGGAGGGVAASLFPSQATGGGIGAALVPSGSGGREKRVQQLRISVSPAGFAAEERGAGGGGLSSAHSRNSPNVPPTPNRQVALQLVR